MEEIDKIIIQSLGSLGCQINAEITSIGQFDQDLLIESVAHLLNAINGDSSEQYPTKLPPNTGVKFRVCSKFATNCQQLGYKNEIGYQTFLYSNESETRRLLTFLIEKLSKDLNIFSASAETGSSQEKTGAKTGQKRALKIKQQVAATVKELLSGFWVPPFVKPKGIKFGQEDELYHEGACGKLGFNTNNLSIPSSKAKYSKEQIKFFESYCKLVTKQSRSKAIDFMASLIELNAVKRAKENLMFKSDINKDESKKAERKAHMNEVKNALKKAVNQRREVGSEQLDVITEADLAEIESILQKDSRLHNFKGSRFTHAQELQFTEENKSDAGKTIEIVESQTDKEKEINRLKENLKTIENQLGDTHSLIEQIEKMIAKLEEAHENQLKLNKKLNEQLSIRMKTVNLINDAPTNILRLKEEINDHEKRLNALKEKFEAAKEPLQAENESLQRAAANKQLEYTNMVQETKEIRRRIDELNSELAEKEALVGELNQELANDSKEASRTTNRQFYTKRILEIVETIDKQRKEIEKILIETRAVQKDINQLSGKLERLFNTTDETLYKDAKKDELTKKIYKLFININTSYEELLKTLEHSSQVEREVVDLEDQVNFESKKKITDNLEKVLNDLNGIKEENEKLIAKLKASKS